MKTSTVAIVGIGVVAVIILFLAFFGDSVGLGGILGGDGDTPPGCEVETYSDLDIYYMFVTLKGKTLDYDQAMAFIDVLDMEAYGIDCENYVDVVDYYNTRNMNDGFNLHSNTPIDGDQWTGSSVIWTQGSQARSLIAGSGSLITRAYGHDTVVLMGEGSYTEYGAFILWITS